MESVVFVNMLRHLTRKRPGAKRLIVRLSEAADYRAVEKAVVQSLSFVRPLPLIRAFSCRGTLSSAFLRRFGSHIVVEEDIPLFVHAFPAQGVGHPVPSDRFSGPFVPPGIRALRVPSVWKRSRGDRVKIGIIDTGVDFLHPDLTPSLAAGINLVNPRTLPFDDNGHGTHVAGTIAAAGRQGMTGIAPHAELLPVKAFDHRGTAYVSDIVKAIDWCVHQEVDIINMSFGMKHRSDAMLEAVRNARSRGVVIVASSGNDGRRGFIDYPARFPQTISVGAIDSEGRIASFSNRGRRIDVFAPGENVLSTWPKGRYYEMNGTSMATAHVTGILALVKSARPGLTPGQMKRIVAAGQVPLPASSTKKTRHPGRIDAVRAFRQLRK